MSYKHHRVVPSTVSDPFWMMRNGKEVRGQKDQEEWQHRDPMHLHLKLPRYLGTMRRRCNNKRSAVAGTSALTEKRKRPCSFDAVFWKEQLDSPLCSCSILTPTSKCCPSGKHGELNVTVKRTISNIEVDATDCSSYLHEAESNALCSEPACSSCKSVGNLTFSQTVLCFSQHKHEFPSTASPGHLHPSFSLFLYPWHTL